MQKLKDKKDEVTASCMKNIIDYFSSIPMEANPRDVNERLQIFVTGLSGIFKPAEQIDFIIKMTTFRHIPIYAHSIMVGKIASCLTEYLAKKNSGCFIGCMDIETAGEASSRVGELCDFAKTGGLCHDIGKITYAGNPFMHARILTDNEFEIVKRHPADGYKMMTREDGNSFFEGHSDIILGHHKYYDNSGGYPEDFDISKSKYRIMIDIVAAADSIDSATDDIWKTYAGVKDLETICAEITAESGRRHSPAVAAVLDDGALRASIGRILAEERGKAYYTAYLHAWS
jgi:response regulator RpfG family c-di-GMP phosphodiesterase